MGNTFGHLVAKNWTDRIIDRQTDSKIYYVNFSKPQR